jgi:hypothetical protein
MKTTAGLWIDHRKAMIVTDSAGDEEVQIIESGTEKQLRRSGDAPLKGAHEAQLVPADDKRQSALTGHLNTYYDAVIACIRDADSILIFGPGEAKGELQRRLKHDHLEDRICGVETVDNMTDNQIVAKVRSYFSGPVLHAGSPHAGDTGVRH